MLCLTGPGFPLCRVPVCVSSKACLASRMTLAIDNERLHPRLKQAFDGGALASVCDSWMRSGFQRCLYWHSCYFLHPTAEALKKAFRHRICPDVLEGAKCERPLCPLVHQPSELTAPLWYRQAWPTDTSHVYVVSYNQEKVTTFKTLVPRCTILNTEGTRWSELQLCNKGSQCDFWSECSFVHCFRRQMREFCLRNKALDWAPALAAWCDQEALRAEGDDVNVATKIASVNLQAALLQAPAPVPSIRAANRADLSFSGSQSAGSATLRSLLRLPSYVLPAGALTCVQSTAVLAPLFAKAQQEYEALTHSHRYQAAFEQWFQSQTTQAFPPVESATQVACLLWLECR